MPIYSNGSCLGVTTALLDGHLLGHCRDSTKVVLFKFFLAFSQDCPEDKAEDEDSYGNNRSND